MKKISILLMLVATLFVATSCSDSGKDISVQKLEIVKSDVLFTYKASTGSIEIKTENPITAQSSEAWCKVSVNSNIVTVNVDELSDKEARSAMISISDGQASVDVPVYQSGTIFGFMCDSIYIVSQATGSINLAGKSNIEYTTATTADWITISEGESGFDVSFASNTGDTRTGNLTFSSAQGKKTIHFIQLGENGFEGTYKASFIGFNEDGYIDDIEKDMTITRNEDGVYLFNELSSLGIGIPFEWDEDNQVFTQKNTTLIASIPSKSYYFRMITLGLSSSGSMYTSTSTSYHIMLGIGWDDETDTYKINLIDSGEWSYTQIGFNIILYKSATSMLSTYKLGNIDSFRLLELIKK